MNRATSNRRLLKLADFLDALPRKRFNYEVWVGQDWQGAPDLSCGTTACALGWAATMPEFRRLGLKLDRSDRDPASGFIAPWMSGGTVKLPTGEVGEEAAAEVFGLTFDEACYLFDPSTDLYYAESAPLSPDEHATAKRVARHIRQFVEHRTEWWNESR